MNFILKYLRQPAPVNRNPVLVVLIASLLVFFLLSLIYLTGSGSIPYWKFVFPFTFVTAFCMVCNGYLFPILFKGFYKASGWTVWKDLLNNCIIFLFIGTGNFLMQLALFPITSYASVFISHMLLVVLVGFIPATVANLVIYNNELKYNLNEARRLNIRLMERRGGVENDEEVVNSLITLTGSTKESIELCPNELLFIESMANYVSVFFMKNDVVRKKELRSTIIQMEKMLQAYPYIQRCHRAFLINTSFIISAEGNSQGLHLTLKCVEEKIPVSRTYIKNIQSKLDEK